jgi:hypothetical protein
VAPYGARVAGRQVGQPLLFSRPTHWRAGSGQVSGPRIPFRRTRGCRLRAFGTGPKYVRGLKPPLAHGVEGRRMGRMGIGGRCSPRTSGTSTPSPSLHSCEGDRPPLCSLNIVALPAQDEPTCIRGRGCREKPRLLLQSSGARVQSAKPHSKGRMHVWRRTPTPPARPPARSLRSTDGQPARE